MLFKALTVSIWQQIQNLDSAAFLALNHQLSNPAFDFILPFFRDSVFWAPLYLFMLAFAVLNYGKKGWWWALGFITTVALADLAGTYIFKENIQRLRPCNNPALAEQVRLVIKACPGGYSFLSNHAANHFGLATFVVLTCKPILKNWVWLMVAWALTISFAQVYVGVHYPLDIIAGALLGCFSGYATASVYHHNFGSLQLLT